MDDENMLFEVLLWLPVKSLLRCKAVCKTWFSLILSPAFLKSHLHRTINTSAADETLIGHICRSANDLDSGAESSFALFQYGSSHHVTELEYPDMLANYKLDDDLYTFIVGSDCGILCVGMYTSSLRDDDWLRTAYKQNYICLIWNPATKRSKLIPPNSLHVDDGTLVALGFGFDHIDYDFKVVRVVSCSVPFEVYSATRNSWGIIEHNVTDIPLDYNFHVCFHGLLLTIGTNGMMAFDLNKEEFICNIKLPFGSNDSARVIDFKDSIAVSNCQGLDNTFNLWTLDNEACFRGSGGTKASWTMVFSIDLGVPLESVDGFFNSVEFLIISSNFDQWFLYDSEKEVVSKVDVNTYFESGTVHKYTESLLSVA